MKVRVQEEEEEEEHFPPQNNNDSSPFLRLIRSLSKQEKENQNNYPPPKIIKAYATSPTSKSSSASDAGTAKNMKQMGKKLKPNVKVSSVLPPRAVLSSPDNDRMIGSMNRLDYERSSSSKKRPASGNVTPSSHNIGKIPRAKTENVKQSPNTAPNIMGKGSKINIVNPSFLDNTLAGSILKDI